MLIRLPTHYPAQTGVHQHMLSAAVILLQLARQEEEARHFQQVICCKIDCNAEENNSFLTNSRCVME
jgi:hypothetical protein